MRYVLSFAMGGMLVACQQQRLPQLQPNPGVAPSVSQPTTVVPSTLAAPAALNPGNLNIELISNENNITVEKDAQGQRHRIALTTDILWPWVVQVSGKDLTSRDILLNSFPGFGGAVVSVDNSNNGPIAIHNFHFHMEYRENVKIEPMELHIVARNMKYCRQIFNDVAEQGKDSVEAVNGIMPEIPESEADCGRMGSANIYNFDQKLRLSLQVENVRDEHKAQQEEKKRQRLEGFVCRMLNSSKAAVVNKATASWSSGNSWTDVFKTIGANFAAELLTHSISVKGFDCNKAVYQNTTRGRSQRNSQSNRAAGGG